MSLTVSGEVLVEPGKKRCDTKARVVSRIVDDGRRKRSSLEGSSKKDLDL